MKPFFSGLPAKVNPGVAFVIIQHLDLKHKSILSALVGRYTDLPVYEINDGMEVKPNCVYIIPPDSYLSYGEDILHLEKPIEPHGHRMPIYFFFRSLAEKKKELSALYSQALAVTEHWESGKSKPKVA